MERAFRVLALLLVGALCMGSLFAQDITKGSIGGVITDSTGAVVPGVEVRLSSPYGERTTTADNAGGYLFPNLVVGSGYAIVVEKSGFRASHLGDLSVRINHRTTVDIVLEVGATTETVQVVGGAIETIDTASTTIGSNIAESVYHSAPIGRNISSVVSMAPGVTDSGGAGTANPSINGASGLENQYVINGANVTDPGFGGFGTFSRVYGSLGNGVNFDFIQEVQVKTGGFEAQYGQALGGIVNVITKSGTNDIHGGIYSYFQPHRFEGSRPNVNDYTETKHVYVQGLSNYDFGFDLGGKIIRDKLFWYGGFNPQYAREFRSADPSFTNSRLGVLSINTRTLNYQGKLNWNIASNHQLEGSVFGDPSKRDEPVSGLVRNTALSANNDLAASSLDYGSRTWTTRYNGTFGPKWIVSGNYSNYYNHFDETPKYNGYRVTDNTAVQEGTGGRVVGGGLGFIETSESKTNQFAIDSSHLATLFGEHTIQYGYQFEDVTYDGIRRYTGPDFTVPNLSDFGDAAGQTQFGALVTREHEHGDPSLPIINRVTRGNYNEPAVHTTTRYHAAFLQDSWNIGRRVTVRPGVRWEEQVMAGNYLRYVFAGNWAPRIGVIVDPTGNRKMKLFANWGRFYEKIPQDIAVRSFSYEYGVAGEWYQDAGAGNAPVLGESTYVPGGSIGFTGGPNNATQIAGGTKSEYQEEAVAGFEKEFRGGFAIQSRFIYRRLQRIIEDMSGINVTQNNAGVPQTYYVGNPSASLDIFTNSSPCTSGPNCDTSIGWTDNKGGAFAPDGIPDGFPNPVRIYKSWETVVSKRLSANWQLYANYRLAKLFGNFEGSFRNDNQQIDPNISSMFDFTNSDGLLAEQFKPGVLPPDRRHVAKIFSNYQFSNGFLRNLNVGGAWNIQSGTPISEFLAHPAVTYDNSGEIPTGGRGKLGRTATNFPVDVHLDYTVKLGERKNLKFVADMFNLFNSKKITRIDQNKQLDSQTDNPDFLKPNGTDFAYPFETPFRARLAIRFEF